MSNDVGVSRLWNTPRWDRMESTRIRTRLSQLVLLQPPKKCLQNSTHVHAGLECRDSFNQSRLSSKIILSTSAPSGAFTIRFFFAPLGRSGCHSKSSGACSMRRFFGKISFNCWTVSFPDTPTKSTGKARLKRVCHVWGGPNTKTAESFIPMPSPKKIRRSPAQDA